tara:strand:- start:358 stop:777 length:420 start_codon:yes stop_codon:yes gene_type:complete
MSLMTPKRWSVIKYFSVAEAWGDPHKMDIDLILALDKLREAADKPIIIHGGYAESGHSENSYHYRGMAADLHIEGYSLLDQFLLAERQGVFGGIGVYPFPEWNNPGLHLDVRKSYQKPVRWARIDGKYVGLTAEIFQGV